MRTVPQRRAGFTLVEVLVAMTLLGILSAMLFGGLRFGARAWDRVAAASDSRDDVMAAQRFLRQRLGTLSLPSGLQRPPGASGLPLRGEADRMSFVTPWRAGPVRSGLYSFTLWRQAASESSGRLMLAWRRLGTTAGEEAEGGEDIAGRRVLLEGVERLDLSFYGTPEGAHAPGWHRRWEGGGGRLGLVLVDVGFSDGRRLWPRFVVAAPG